MKVKNRTLNIDVNSPNKNQNTDIVWEKLQARPNNYDARNFSTNTINCIDGEIIRYLIKIRSNSTVPLYNIKITDDLDKSFSYIQNSFYGRYFYYTDTTNTTSIEQIWGTPIFNVTNSILSSSGELFIGGPIEWSIPFLSGIGVASTKAFYAELFFDCRVKYVFLSDTLN